MVGKTIQFRERVVHVPLPAVPDSPLCPVTAVKRALHFTGQSPPTSQAFAFLSSPDFTPKPLTYPMFLCKQRCILDCVTCQPKIMLPILFVGVEHPLLSKPGFLLNRLKCLGTGIPILCFFTLQYPFTLDYNQLM